jgi:hypothetical protein
MNTPEFKQFGDLVQSDFERYPVWIGCHTVDGDEPWYDETDEETFRPWNGSLPTGPSEGMLLVRATMEFADGTLYLGSSRPPSMRMTLAPSSLRYSSADGVSDFGAGW